MKNPNWIVALMTMLLKAKMFGQRFCIFQKPDTLPAFTLSAELPHQLTAVESLLSLTKIIALCPDSTGSLRRTDEFDTIHITVDFTINAHEFIAAVAKLEKNGKHK